jgi:hypothetical protein
MPLNPSQVYVGMYVHMVHMPSRLHICTYTYLQSVHSAYAKTVFAIRAVLDLSTPATLDLRRPYYIESFHVSYHFRTSAGDVHRSYGTSTVQTAYMCSACACACQKRGHVHP